MPFSGDGWISLPLLLMFLLLSCWAWRSRIGVWGFGLMRFFRKSFDISCFLGNCFEFASNLFISIIDCWFFVGNKGEA